MHHKTDEELENEKPFVEVWTKLRAWLGRFSEENFLFIAHNAMKTELPRMKAEFAAIKQDMPKNWYWADTINLHKSLQKSTNYQKYQQSLPTKSGLSEVFF